MLGSARRSWLPERALRNDAVRHQRSIQTISLAIASWLSAKIRSGLPHFVRDLPIESSDAASACGPCPLLAIADMSCCTAHVRLQAVKQTSLDQTSLTAAPQSAMLG